MINVGIICEYNPFHNGHKYHISKIKEMFPNCMITAVMSGNFTQRGIPSILSTSEKAKIAINNEIDLIIELPAIFSTQSADIFASGAIQILDKLKIDYLVFGSECNDISLLENIAKIQLNDPDYNSRVKAFLDEGFNYPTAMSKALNINFNIETPNDLLGISYIKAILINKSKIRPLTIKRTNDFHSKKIDKEISSATSIRESLKLNKDISKAVPENVYSILKQKKSIDYFPILKYKIISEGKDINKYLTVDEGIENRILKVINECNTVEELILKIKTKRYTYNKLSRMFIHILCSITKDEAKNNREIKYIQVIEFNKNGQNYLNSIKKQLDIPLITTKKYYKDLLIINKRCDDIYKFISNNM